MEHTSYLQQALYYLVAAVIAVPLFKRAGLGAILGYLCAGILLGPDGLKLINQPETVLHFSEFGVVMLLFVIGLELDPNKLWDMRLQISLIGGGQLLLSALVIAVALTVLDVSLPVAIVLGLTLALSSTAFAIQLLAEQNILATPLGRKGLAILLLQDMAVIPLLLLVDALSPVTTSGEENTTVLLGIVAVLMLVAVGRFVVNPLLKVVARSGVREIMTAAGLLIVIGVATLMQAVGLSMGLGAFIAGILLANSSFRHQLETDIEPFKGLLLGLFFIAVGMSLKLDLFLLQPLTIVGYALLLIAVKSLIITLICRFRGVPLKDGLLLGLTLSQGGEFAFVVIAQANQQQFIGSDIGEVVMLVVGVSMALTSPLVALYRMWTSKRPKTEKAYDDIGKKEHSEEHPEVIIAGFGRFGQIVGRILAANKIPFTALDKDADRVDFVKLFGNEIYYGNALRADLLEKAGIEQARLLIVAVAEMDESIEVIRLARQRCPNIKIVARAHNRRHAYQLYAMGIEHVIRETFSASLEVAVYTLMELGFTEGHALEQVDIFRFHDERLIRDAVEHRDDMENLIKIAKEGRQELESLFRRDDSKSSH